MINSYTGFTSNFIDRLGESTRQLDEFVAQNKEKANALVSNLHQVEADEQQNIDSLLRKLKSVQHERGVVASSAKDGGGVAEQRKMLESKQLKLEQEVSRLTSKNRVDKSQMEDVLVKETAMRQKADKTRERKEAAEAARGVTLEDLTKGLLNYKFTGLSFARGGEKGILDFKFTKVDPADESRHFSFTVYLDEDNDYQLSNCNPSLGKTKTRPLVDQLNLDGKEGFNSFTIGIRKLFKETV